MNLDNGQIMGLKIKIFKYLRVPIVYTYTRRVSTFTIVNVASDK